MAVFYDDLWHEQMLWADFTDVRQIDISLEETDYTLTSEQDSDDHAWFYQEEELEDRRFPIRTGSADRRPFY